MATERTLILPLRDNGGVSLAAQVASVKREILAIAGGYSEVKQVGAWRDADGTIYRDTSWRLTTTVDDDQDAAIVARLPEWCARLRQICLYTHSTQVASEFVYANVPQTAIA